VIDRYCQRSFVVTGRRAHVAEAPSVFLSYSRGNEFDRLVRDKLGVLLQPLVEDGVEVFVDDTALGVGERLTPTITGAIERATVAVLLVSPDYLDRTRYAGRIELPAIAARVEAGRCRLVPVLTRKCLWQRAPELDDRLLSRRIDERLPESGQALEDALFQPGARRRARHRRSEPPALPLVRPPTSCTYRGTVRRGNPTPRRSNSSWIFHRSERRSSPTQAVISSQ
jgi:hypothetical protein